MKPLRLFLTDHSRPRIKHAFALLCNDKPDHLQVRLDTRPAHLDYLKGLGDVLKFAGPFLGEDGKPNGSLVVVEAADKAAAEKIAANDPYALAGLLPM